VVKRGTFDACSAPEKRDGTVFQERWRQALEKSAGVAPYLQEGAEYVDDVRRADAERRSCGSDAA
jgi:hypothetical protein